MEFNNELHKQLFCCFITESNSKTYRCMNNFNSESAMESFIALVIMDYENFYEDRTIFEEVTIGL